MTNPARRRRLAGPLPSLLLLAAIALAALLPAVDAAAAFAPAEWRYYKPITLPPELTAGPLVEVTLDRQVFANAAAEPYDLRDLRLIRDGNIETPYQLTIAAGREGWEVAPLAAQFPAESLPDSAPSAQYASFVADLGTGRVRHNRVEVLTNAVNFNRAAIAETSNDAQSWTAVQEGVEIFDFSVPARNFQARNTRIEYPESAARYVRVQVRADGPEPLAITGLEIALTREQQPRETAYAPAVINSATVGGNSVVTLDLGAAGIPTSRLTFATALANFHRDAEIAGSVDGDNWQTLSGAAVYAYAAPRFTGSSKAVTYPESNYRYYQLTVMNGDDPPLPLDNIALHSVDRRLLFQPQPGASYALYYGNDYAESPIYDLAQTAQYQDTANLPAATLGMQQANPAYTGAEIPWTERYPWLLPAVVIIAGLALAALLYGVARQARGGLRPPE